MAIPQMAWSFPQAAVLTRTLMAPIAEPRDCSARAAKQGGLRGLTQQNQIVAVNHFGFGHVPEQGFNIS